MIELGPARIEDDVLLAHWPGDALVAEVDGIVPGYAKRQTIPFPLHEHVRELSGYTFSGFLKVLV